MSRPTDGRAEAQSDPTFGDDGEISYCFGEFVLIPRQRKLLAGTRVVQLGSRALEVLVVLIEAQGALVSKSELLRQVWPSTTVRDENVNVQIAAIRKILGKSYGMLRTDAGRGYRFAGAVRQTATARGAAAVLADRDIVQPGWMRANLPATASPILGREIEITKLLGLLAEHRLVTLTGPGGIGKTQLALEVARRAGAEFPDGVRLAEFGSLTDPEMVPNAIARGLGLQFELDSSAMDCIVAAVSGKRILLVLDNCEHVIDVATRLIERLLREAPQIHVLTTSQEILMAEGEWAYRVNSLKVPTVNVCSAELAIEYSAVQLFVARAQAVDPTFMLDDRTAGYVSRICRSLDGIPLAIELVTAYVATVGVDTLANGIDRHFFLRTGGRRTALKRHQTLSAMFDWSYGLLDPVERIVLRRLAIFVASFTLEDAAAVAAVSDEDRTWIVEYVTRLFKKSLVTREAREPVSRFRLLGITRIYAMQKLSESGELDCIANRHAEYFLGRLERMRDGSSNEITIKLATQYAHEISAALQWAFEQKGRSDLGVALATGCVPLWTLSSNLGACRDLVSRALSRLDNRSSQRIRQEMLLQTAFAHSLIWSEGASKAVVPAAERALEIAERLDDPECQLRALYVQWAHLLLARNFRACLVTAQRFGALAEQRNNPTFVISSERLLGTTLHYLGDLAQARITLESSLCKPSLHSPVRFGLDDRIAALTQLARVLWLQGFPSRAAHTVALAIREADALNHANSLCFAICSGGCSIAALGGDLLGTERLAERLIDCADEPGLKVWQSFGHAFQYWVASQRGYDISRLEPLTWALNQDKGTRFLLDHPSFTDCLSDGLATTGRVDEGLALIGRAVEDASSAGCNWCLPELLRLKGEYRLRYFGLGEASVVETDLISAFTLSQEHGARSWELRSATSLARLWQQRGQEERALMLLSGTFGWFTEGFETTDLVAAAAIIDALKERHVELGRMGSPRNCGAPDVTEEHGEQWSGDGRHPFRVVK